MTVSKEACHQPGTQRWLIAGLRLWKMPGFHLLGTVGRGGPLSSWKEVFNSLMSPAASVQLPYVSSSNAFLGHGGSLQVGPNPEGVGMSGCSCSGKGLGDWVVYDGLTCFAGVCVCMCVF